MTVCISDCDNRTFKAESKKVEIRIFDSVISTFCSPAMGGL